MTDSTNTTETRTSAADAVLANCFDALSDRPVQSEAALIFLETLLGTSDDIASDPTKSAKRIAERLASGELLAQAQTMMAQLGAIAYSGNHISLAAA